MKKIELKILLENNNEVLFRKKIFLCFHLIEKLNIN